MSDQSKKMMVIIQNKNTFSNISALKMHKVHKIFNNLLEVSIESMALVSITDDKPIAMAQKAIWQRH